MEQTLSEFGKLYDEGGKDAVVEFLQAEMKESYKNGAQAERRKAFKKADATPKQ